MTQKLLDTRRKILGHRVSNDFGATLCNCETEDYYVLMEIHVFRVVMSRAMAHSARLR
jgi:hypothetical protein